MAKRFFHVAAGIFLLVVAYQLGASRAVADWSPGGGYAVAGGASNRWFSQSGQAWLCDIGTGFVRWPELDLPVPVDDVRFLAPDFLVTQGDQVWQWQAGNWHLIGVFPGGAVSVEGQSFGKTKAAYR